ncbi:MAG: hypothetical protein J5626_03865 [Lachnospiraceae bacterium]|nr:hypothetical protein [Lachnospiraceae bacterium]
MKRNSIKGWITNNTHYLIYVFCVVGLFVVNTIRVNGTGAQWGFANEFVGLIVFVMLTVRTGVKDYIKPRTGIIALAFAAVFPFVFSRFRTGTDYDMRLVGRYVSFFFCVILIIRFLEILIKTKKPLLKRNIVFILWLLLMITCIASRNKSIVPFYVLIFFGSFYFEPVTDEEKGVLLNAITDGIIVGFFIYQSLAFLHSPYDIARYRGFFSNSDCNAKFYTISYIGFLMKYSLLRRRNKKTAIIFFLFGAAMLGFTLFTVMRSGLFAVGLVTLVYLIVEEIMLFRTGFKGFILQGMKLAVVALISLPIIYICIRYIPALRHHPIFHGTYSEKRVHAWDPIDSEKYISPEEFLEVSFGRKLTFSYTTKDVDFSEDRPETETQKKKNLPEIASIKELTADGQRVIEYEDGTKPGTDSSHPVYIKLTYTGRFENLFGIRKYIFETYLRDVKLMGNVSEFSGYWLTCEWAYTSSHCTYLDFASRYGILATVAYILFIAAVVIISFKRIKQNASIHMHNIEIPWLVFSLCVMVACIGWGIVYSTLFWGEILESMFWLSVFPVINIDEKEEMNAIV